MVLLIQASLPASNRPDQSHFSGSRERSRNNPEGGKLGKESHLKNKILG